MYMCIYTYIYAYVNVVEGWKDDCCVINPVYLKWGENVGGRGEE